MAASSTLGLYEKLQRHIDNHAYKAGLSVCKQLFESDPCDETRWAYISLLLLERQADKASKLFTPGLSEQLSFEHAYCLYRESRFDEARALIEGLDAAERESVPFKELLAQVLYKLEAYDEALVLYRSLVVNPEYGELPIELKANFAATTVGSSLGKAMSTDEAREGFEVMYNEATRCVAAGEYKRAEALLSEALETATTVLTADGFTQEEVDEEVAMIRAQLGYVMLVTGREEEAMAVYSAVVESGLKDETVLAVANNNITCVRRDSDLFDSMKKSSKASAEVLKRRLTQAQQQAIAFNRALLFMYMGRLDQCRSLATELMASNGSTVTPALILAAMHLREKKISKAQNVLNDAMAQDAVTAQLAIAQMSFAEKRWADASTALASPALDAIRDTPAFVGTQMALLQAQGDEAGAMDVLDAALDAQPGNVHMIRGAADYLLDRGYYARATMLYSQLLQSSSGESGELRARLALALAHTDIGQAESAVAAFPAPAPATQASAAELEKALLGVPVRRAAKPAASASSKGKENIEDEVGANSVGNGNGNGNGNGPAGPAVTIRRKRRKKKKNPPAKNFDPDKAPNPYRWLPKHERPGYVAPRRRRRRGGRKIGTATQGAASSGGGGGGGGGGKKGGGKKGGGKKGGGKKGGGKKGKKKGRR